MLFKGREIDYGSLEVDGIDMADYPDFCDAYFASGNYADGEMEDLNDSELDELTDKFRDEVHCKVYNYLF